jgi:hypothetical protein
MVKSCNRKLLAFAPANATKALAGAGSMFVLSL